MFAVEFRLQFCLNIIYRNFIPKPELSPLGIYPFPGGSQPSSGCFSVTFGLFPGQLSLRGGPENSSPSFPAPPSLTAVVADLGSPRLVVSWLRYHNGLFVIMAKRTEVD